MEKSPFGFHEGEALHNLAKYYPRIIDVLLEVVQNAIDKNATRIMLTINQKVRNIVVRDDGDGVTLRQFEDALTSISSSKKRKDQLGRFGLGLISPLGKCVRFLFTSTPRQDPHSYLEWTFDSEDLRVQKKITGIPMRARKDLHFTKGESANSRSASYVPWRTQVSIENYTVDKQINRVTFESLRDGILDRFGASMRRKNTLVLVTITDENGHKGTHEIRAKDFEGARIEEVELSEQDSGRTTFRLFLARKADRGRKGKVLVGEAGNDFRLDFNSFNRSLPEVCELAHEVVAALGSGVFEGEILNTRIQLQASRRGFEASDALTGFCSSLEKWYEEYGSKYYKEAQEQRQEERYQSLGARSLKVLEDILKQPAFAGMRKAFERFSVGTVGPGHVEKRGKIAPIKSLSAQGAAASNSNGDSDRAYNPKEEPEDELKNHNPLTVRGPKGSYRRRVRNNSLGLELWYDAMQGSDNLWILEEETGTLRINVLHPLWRQCEDHSDKTLMRFQEYLMLQALGLLLGPPEWSQHARLVLDEINAPYVHMLIHGDQLAGRLPGRSGKQGELKIATRTKLTLARKRA